MANATAGRPANPKAYRPIRSMGLREWLVQSSTHKEVDYHVLRNTPHGSAFTCDCPWGAHQAELTGKECRHVKAVKQRIGLLPRDPVEPHAEPAAVVDPDDGDPWAGLSLFGQEPDFIPNPEWGFCGPEGAEPSQKAASLPQDRRSGPWAGITDEERLAGIKAFWKENRT